MAKAKEIERATTLYIYTKGVNLPIAALYILS